MDNKTILLKGNELIAAGDHEGFLALCREDMVWEFVGDQVLRGKEAVRKYMSTVYVEPPAFDLQFLIAEGDHLVATGKISLKNDSGKIINYDYCDVWQLRDGLLAELKAFVV